MECPAAGHGLPGRLPRCERARGRGGQRGVLGKGESARRAPSQARRSSPRRRGPQACRPHFPDEEAGPRTAQLPAARRTRASPPPTDHGCRCRADLHPSPVQFTAISFVTRRPAVVELQVTPPGVAGHAAAAVGGLGVLAGRCPAVAAALAPPLPLWPCVPRRPLAVVTHELGARHVLFLGSTPCRCHSHTLASLPSPLRPH